MFLRNFFSKDGVLVKPGLLQKILFVALFLAALAIGVFVATAFLALAVLLIPLFFIRVYWLKRRLRQYHARQQKAPSSGPTHSSSDDSAGRAGQVFEGEYTRQDPEDR